MGQTRRSSTSVFNVERSYSNGILQKSMNKVINRRSRLEVFYKKKCSLKFPKTQNTVSGTGVFLWILWNLLEHLFYGTPPVAASVLILLDKEKVMNLFFWVFLKSWTLGAICICFSYFIILCLDSFNSLKGRITQILKFPYMFVFI